MTAPQRRQEDSAQTAGRMRKADRKRQLLAHAKQFFAAQGYQGTTTAQIATAAGIAEAVTKATEEETFDVVIVNFANADMVGHSGKIPPTITAVETVDAALGSIAKAVKRKGGAMLVTADHGNAEMMIDPETGGPHTAHTTNPVPLIMVSENSAHYGLRADGALQDISPTILGMLEIPQPKEMTGHDLRVPTATK